eukprot:gene11557-11701_t
MAVEIVPVAVEGIAAESWKGPLSVAVYVPAPQHSTAAQASLRLIQHSAEAFSQDNPMQPLLVSVLFAQHFAREGVSALRGRIDPSDHPLLQPHAAPSPTYDQLYPINALRNLALQQVATPFVLFADADFVFASNLLRQLNSSQPNGQRLVEQLLQTSSAQQQQDQGEQQRAAPVMLVVPCFQLELGQDLPDTERAAVPANKTDLRQAVTSGTVVPFHCGVFAPLKQPIDINRWLGEVEAYEVPFVEYFEPQGIAVKQQLPLYDECFRGYGLNKVQHAWHMAALGFKFKVLPDAFMVTAPHTRSSTWRPQPGTASDDEHLTRIGLVYDQFKLRVRQQIEQQL